MRHLLDNIRVQLLIQCPATGLLSPRIKAPSRWSSETHCCRKNLCYL